MNTPMTDLDTLTRLCSVNDFEVDDEPIKVTVEGRDLAVYQLEGHFFASDDLCTHGEASLSDGEIEDGKIICPFHLGSFDIRTGEPAAAPCIKPLKVYRVIRDGDDLFVELEG